MSAALDVAIQIATALMAAHAAGIVHRDIKPGNVMGRPDGLVKVLDFELAKLTDQSLGEAAVARASSITTESGAVLGTPRYTSPEQVRGVVVDAHTDLFSLGVMLYEMLATLHLSPAKRIRTSCWRLSKRNPSCLHSTLLPFRNRSNGSLAKHS